MYLVGLTGGIASGKSTLAGRWVEAGAIEIDADSLAREVIAEGTDGLLKLRAAFGSEVFGSDGTLDRRALATVVFQDSSKRTQLENIIHPLVRERSVELMENLPKDSIVIYNVPLLIEANVQLAFDKIVTTEAPESVQIERLVKYRGMTRPEAKARIEAQATAAQRAARADILINTDKPMADLLQEADALWLEIEREAKAKLNA